MNKIVLLTIGVVLIVGCDYKPRNQGKSLYGQHCLSCHMDNGEGLGALFPPLQNADYVLEHKEELACIIRHGIEGELEVNGVKYDGQMVGNVQLTDAEISNLVHYLLVDLNQQEEYFTVLEIKEQLKSCPID